MYVRQQHLDKKEEQFYNIFANGKVQGEKEMTRRKWRLTTMAIWKASTRINRATMCALCEH